MAFTDDFTGTFGDYISARTGWTGTASAGPKIGINIANGGPVGHAICTDQGSADQYTQAKTIHFAGGFANSILAVRLVDRQNCIGYLLGGVGAAGRRLSKIVAGTQTDLITSQGVSGEWIKVEAEGTSIRLYEGGTGATPSWTQVGSDQTVSDFSTETSQGLALNDGGTGDLAWLDDFEAGALAAPAADTFFQNQLHPIECGLRPVTAAGLNGVLVT